MFAFLLDYLDGLYPRLLKCNFFFGKNFFCRVILSCIYRLNNMLCWYYHNVKKTVLPSPEDVDYVVSLTTYPARVDNLWKVLEIAFNQRDISVRYAVCLWLIEEEFEGKELPQQIKRLQDRGLQVRFEKENLRCHNKYFYAFRNYPGKNIITIDDDLQYNHHTISALIQVHNEFPNSIVYNRGNKINRNGFKKFGSWIRYEEVGKNMLDVCPAGVGGVLYPPKSCSDLVLNAGVIKKTCLCADDLWLNFMSRLLSTYTVYSGLVSAYIVLPDSDQSSALYLNNVKSEGGGNDIQIDNISEWAKTELGCDFYVNVNE